jgi:hypothetical protein
MPKAKLERWPASEVEWLARSQIVPNENNARRHSDDQIEGIARSIVEYGWTIPLLIDEVGILIAGEGRWLAAGRLIERGDLKSDLLPVMRATGWSEEKKRLYIIADNKLTENSTWDFDALAAELAWLDDQGADLSLSGFDGDELADLIGALSGDGGDGDGDGDGASLSLAERFGFVPFSVFSAREGSWQDRKRAWLALGILSEVGRGARPGGSRQPAVGKDGKIYRADSRGKAIEGARTDAEADKMIVKGKGWGDGGPARRDPAFYAKKRAYEKKHGKIGTKEFREKHWNPDESVAAGKATAQTYATGLAGTIDKMRETKDSRQERNRERGKKK